MTGRKRQPPPPAPDELAAGRSCDGGYCNAESIGWRWFVKEQEWLPACGKHMYRAAGPDEYRVYDEEQP